MLYENSDYMNFYTFTQTDENTVFIDMGLEYKPSEATEITWFASLGYWKSIKNDPLYPDDFPLDVTQSMSSDTDVRKGLKINTNVPDGDYNYYFYLYDNYKNFAYTIKNHRINAINGLTIDNYPNNKEIYMGYNIGTNISFFISTVNKSNLPTTVLVQQYNAIGISTNIIVVRHNKIEIPINMEVYYKSQIPTNLSVINDEKATKIDFIVQRKDKTSIPTDLIVKRTESPGIPTNLIVKRYEHNNIPINMVVYCENKIATDLTVAVVVDNEKLKTDVHVCRVIKSYLPVNIIVKRTNDIKSTKIELIVNQKDSSPLLTTMDVLAWDRNTLPTTLNIPQISQEDKQLPIGLSVVRNTNIGLPTFINVEYKGNNFEQIANFNKPNIYDDSHKLPISINVFNPLTKQLFTQMYIVNKYHFESVSNIINTDVNDKLTTLSVIRNNKNNLYTTIIVDSRPVIETICNTKTINDKSAINTTLSVVRNDINKIPITFVVNKKAQLQTTNYFIEYKHPDKVRIPTELTVIRNNHDELPINFNVVKQNYGFESTVELFAIEGKAPRIKTTLEVKNYKNDNLPTKLNIVKSFAPLKATSVFTHKIETGWYTDMEVVYTRQSELQTTMFVNSRASFESDITITNKINNNLKTFLAIPIKEQLKTTMYVSTENFAPLLKAPSKLGAPQIAEKTVYAIKDSYIYNSKRLMNFGYRTNMHIGNTKSYDIMSALIGFDFADLNIDRSKKDAKYYGYQIVQKAILHLNVENPIYTGDIIKVYSITDNWSEKSINYDNFNKVKKLAYITEVKAPNKNGRFNIDITKDLLDFEDFNSTKRSYYLEIDTRNRKSNNNLNISSAQTKLGKQAIPSVTVTYYHTPDIVDWQDKPTTLEVNPNSNLPTDLFVVLPDESKLPTTIEVRSEQIDRRMMKIHMEVVQDHYNNDLETTLDVIKYDCDEKGTRIDLYIPLTPVYDNLATTIYVSRNPSEEMYVYLL